MSYDPLPVTIPDAASARFAERSRLWGGGWRRWAFPGIWLIYLAQTVGGVHKHSTGAAALAGYLIVVVFAVCYLSAIPSGWNGTRRRFWLLYLSGFALTGLEAIFAQDDAFVFFVYLAVLTVACVRGVAVPIITAMVLFTLFAATIVPGWSGKLAVGSALAIALVSLAMFGFFGVIRSNIELAAARAEVARLAAENERSRIARDLHDLLGHSLTTITVKSGLARRLADRGEAARAAAEIGEVEQLCRRTLVEVRAAVSGYRDVTLGGELASAREVLRAAGIEADLPAAIDIVDADATEPFGWVVREGVTNVVRHSRALHCTITLGPRWIEIVDDGRGGVVADGNGLAGLRERLAAVGGTVEASRGLRGWRLRAQVGPLAQPHAAEADASVLRG
jgi:two-component system, NarL family, sensor histidine kinase DesK